MSVMSLCHWTVHHTSDMIFNISNHLLPSNFNTMKIHRQKFECCKYAAEKKYIFQVMYTVKAYKMTFLFTAEAKHCLIPQANADILWQHGSSEHQSQPSFSSTQKQHTDDVKQGANKTQSTLFHVKTTTVSANHKNVEL